MRTLRLPHKCMLSISQQQGHKRTTSVSYVVCTRFGTHPLPLRVILITRKEDASAQLAPQAVASYGLAKPAALSDHMPNTVASTPFGCGNAARDRVQKRRHRLAVLGVAGYPEGEREAASWRMGLWSDQLNDHSGLTQPFRNLENVRPRKSRQQRIELIASEAAQNLVVVEYRAQNSCCCAERKLTGGRSVPHSYESRGVNNHAAPEPTGTPPGAGSKHRRRRCAASPDRASVGAQRLLEQYLSLVPAHQSTRESRPRTPPEKPAVSQMHSAPSLLRRSPPARGSLLF